MLNKKLLSTILCFILTFQLRITFANGITKTPTLNFATANHRDLGTFYNGLAPSYSKDNSLLGYINIKGELVIDYQFDARINYDDISKADYEKWPEYTFNKYPQSHKYIEEFTFKNGYAKVFKNGKSFYIDTTGNKIDNTFSGKYYFAGPFVNSRAVAQKTKNGLFGYINKNGNPITDFKYINASNFKDGVASVTTFEPFKNGKTKYLPLDTTLTNDELDNLYPIRATYMPKNYDVIDLFIDTDGSVLSWQFHELEYIDENFRTRIVFELDEVSQELILKDKSFIRPDGKVAISFENNKDFVRAYPFSKENIAKIRFKNGDNYYDKYINAKGEVQDQDTLKKQYPNLFRGLKYTYLNKDGVGDNFKVVTIKGEKYLLENDSPVEIDRKDTFLKFYLVDVDGKIIKDCTTEILEKCYEIQVKNFLYSSDTGTMPIDYYNEKDSIIDRIAFYKMTANSNVYSMSFFTSRHGFEVLCFFTIEGWE